MQVFRCTLGRQIHNQRATGRTRGSQGVVVKVVTVVSFAGTVSAMGQRTGGNSGFRRLEGGRGKEKRVGDVGWRRTRTRGGGDCLCLLVEIARPPTGRTKEDQITTSNTDIPETSLYLTVYLLQIIQIVPSNLASIFLSSRSLGIKLSFQHARLSTT